MLRAQLGYYGLEDWWNSFSADEQLLIESRFTPLGALQTDSVESILFTTESARDFVRHLSGWFRKSVPAEAAVGAKIQAKADAMFVDAERPGLDVPGEGLVDGRHFTEYVERVEQLKRDGELEAALGLLKRLDGAAAGEAKASGYAKAPWYERQIGIVERQIARRTS